MHEKCFAQCLAHENHLLRHWEWKNIGPKISMGGQVPVLQVWRLSKKKEYKRLYSCKSEKRSHNK